MKYLIISISLILGFLSPALAEKATIELELICEAYPLPRRHTFLCIVSNHDMPQFEYLVEAQDEGLAWLDSADHRLQKD